MLVFLLGSKKPTLPTIFSSSDQHIHLDFTTQSHLGWFATLCGYLSQDLVTAQALYYILISSKKSATKWGSLVTAQLWNISFQLWDNQNSILFQNETRDRLNGLAILKQCVTREFYTGRADLSPVYGSYFTQLTLDQLLSKRTAYLKRWFLVIRSAIEAIHVFPDDQFSVDSYLRSWVHLPPR